MNKRIIAAAVAVAICTGPTGIFAAGETGFSEKYDEVFALSQAEQNGIAVTGSEAQTVAENGSDPYTAEQLELSAPGGTAEAGEEDVELLTGALELSAVDLALPGKGGLDVVIKREYNSGESIDAWGKSNVITLIGGQDVSNMQESYIYIYPYHIDGNMDSNTIFIGYDSKHQVVESEIDGAVNALGSYTINAISKNSWSKPNSYSLELLPSDEADAMGFHNLDTFIHINALPKGDEVRLIRDKTKSPAKISLKASSSEEGYVESVQMGHNVFSGWRISMPELTVNRYTTSHDDELNGRVDLSNGKIRQFETGSFTDPDTGQTLTYSGYFDMFDDETVKEDSSGGNVISFVDRGAIVYSDMYSIKINKRIDDEMNLPGPDILSRPLNDKEYRMIITRYDGTKFYFSHIFGDRARQLKMVRRSDKFGNSIYYYYNYAYEDGICDGIIDTYGRNIKMLREQEQNYVSKITVDDVPVVEYVTTEINNDVVDPANIMYDDNQYKLIVKKGIPGTDISTVTYTSEVGNDLIYRGLELTSPSGRYNGMCSAFECPTMRITEIETSTGSKIRYTYEKQMAMFQNNLFAVKQYYRIVSRESFEQGSGTPIAHMVYSYDHSDNDNKKSVMKKYGTGYEQTSYFNKEDNLKENVIVSNYGKKITSYTYHLTNEGVWLPIQTVTKNMSTNATNSVTTDLTYNSKQQVTSITDGLHEKQITYDRTYGLVKEVKERQTNTLWTGTANTISSDGKTVKRTDYFTKKDSSAQEKKERIDYQYDACGDLTVEQYYDRQVGGSSYEKRYRYEYPVNANPQQSSVSLRKTTTMYVNNQTDAQGIPTGQTREQAVNVTQEYNYLGQLQKTVDGKGNTASIEYDTRQRPVKWVNTDGTSRTAVYNTTDNYIIVSNENGVKHKFQYDTLGRQTASFIENESGGFERVLEIKYDKFSRPSEKILYSDPSTESSRTVYEYFNDDKIKTETIKEGDKVLIQKQYQYNPAYSASLRQTVVSLKDDSGRLTEVENYTDLWGNMKKQERSIPGQFGIYWGMEADFTTDIMGNILTQTDFMGNKTTNEYDNQNRLIKTTNPAGKSMTYQYNIMGDVLSVTDYRGNTTTMQYDQSRRMILKQIPVAGTTVSKTKYYYDDNGNLTRREQQNNKSGAVESYSVTRYTYDAMNRRTAVIGNDGNSDNITAYEYDNAGNILNCVQGLTSLTEEVNPGTHTVTHYEYDKQNRLVKERDALGLVSQMQYDNLGNTIGVVDRNGNSSTFQYDGMGRLISKNAKDAWATYEYDMTGNLSKMTDATGSVSYMHNGLGWIEEEKKDNITKRYGYNENGSCTSFKLSNNDIVDIDSSYEYNNLNQLTAVTVNGEKTNYTYDDNGNLLSSATGDKASASYSYNLANQLTGQSNRSKAGALQNYTLSYYLDGRISAIGENDGVSTAYVYDGLGRLVSEDHIDTKNPYKSMYTYDKQGNRIKAMGIDPYEIKLYETSYQYDGNNRLKREETNIWSDNDVNITDYFYDFNGNRTAEMKSVLKGTEAEADSPYSAAEGNVSTINKYAYDGLNQLISSVVNGNTTDYIYDGTGLRQSKTTNGITTKHIYDGQNVVVDTIGTQKNVYARGIGLISGTFAGSKNYYHCNVFGDVTAVTDATGTITADYRYDFFGRQVKATENDSNPFRYQGMYYDSETEYIYHKGRYYDPAVGQQLSKILSGPADSERIETQSKRKKQPIPGSFFVNNSYTNAMNQLLIYGKLANSSSFVDGDVLSCVPKMKDHNQKLLNVIKEDAKMRESKIIKGKS